MSWLVRPVAPEDADGLKRIAADALPSVSTIPRTHAAIARAIERSVTSFAETVDVPGDEYYMLVLEDGDGRLCGLAAVAATAGADGTFFAFRNDVIHQVSRDLGVSNSIHALTLCSDLTGYSQLLSFYVADPARSRYTAELLSRARLLLAVTAPERFSERFTVSLAGMTDAQRCSHFWDALGRQFFGMDYLAAEKAVEGARNRTLIVELMPHYPVYVPLLPGEAQAVMGQLHPEAVLPFEILTREGFEADQYIDIFDGGPILQARRTGLRTVFGSAQLKVAATPLVEIGTRMLVAAYTEGRYRCVLADAVCNRAAFTIALSQAACRRLDVTAGDPVFCVAL